jgi:hypothetical protein
MQTDVKVLYFDEAGSFVSKPLWNRMQIKLHIEVKGHVFLLRLRGSFLRLDLIYQQLK